MEKTSFVLLLLFVGRNAKKLHTGIIILAHEMSRVFESIIMYFYCFCLLFRSKERRIRPSNQDDVLPFEE